VQADSEIIDQYPANPRKEADDAGLRFGLTEAVFARWWKSIPPEFRDEFVTLHRGCPDGDLSLARFVCALDHLLIQQNRAQTAGIIVDAWALAIKAPPHDRDIGAAAGDAWKHDAVQQLLYRIRDSQARQSVARIERLLTSALEDDLLAGDQKRRDAAVKNGIAFIRLIEERQQKENDQRLKRGMARLEEDNQNVRAALVRPTEDQAVEHMRSLIDIYGAKAFAGLLERALPGE
jgi:hypothetical protein